MSEVEKNMRGTLYSLYYSLLFTTLISVSAIYDIIYVDNIYNINYTSYQLLFFYLFTDIIRYLLFDINNLHISIFLHHIIGLIGVFFAYSNYYYKIIIDKYLLYEISTIFLNMYLIKKTYIYTLLFFISFTSIRIIYGSTLLLNLINDTNINNLYIFISLFFQSINYYWYYYIIHKLIRVYNS